MANPIAQRLQGLERTSPKTFRLDGLDYIADNFGVGLQTTVDRLLVLKPDDYFPQYAQVLGGAPTRNVLELGIFQGGSAMAFASLLDPQKLVTVDICDPIPAFDEIRKGHPNGQKISVHYNTSQDDEAKLGQIIASEFDGPIDLVIDDASHFYEETKRSFEIVFPHVRPGGLYAIEDWGWAHAPGFHLWTDKTAMSNLIYELLMISVSRRDLIASFRIFNGICFVQKSKKATLGEPFDVDALAYKQGRAFHRL